MAPAVECGHGNMGLLNTIGIGRSGMKVASYGIEVTAQNVTNAESEGYVRRTLSSETRMPRQLKRGAYLGQGVTTATVRRSIDRFITERHMDSVGQESQSRTAFQNLEVLEANFSEGEISGLSDQFDAFFDSLTELTLEPSDLGLRKGVVESGKDLATAINRASTAVEDNVRRVEERLTDEMAGINDILGEISSLNKQITDGDAITGPGDILDQRDAALGELVEKIGGSLEYKSSGQVNLYLGGHAVIQDIHSRDFSISGATGSKAVSLSLDGATIDVTDILGGELGGLIAAREVSQTAGADLDTFTQDFADAFNLQHSLGFDGTGASGGDFFTYGGTAPGASVEVDSALVDDVELIAAAGAPSAAVGDGDNLEALRDVEDASLFTAGTQNAREFISSIYSDIGTSVKSFSIDQRTEAATLDDLSSLHNAMSGVDLDEEAVKLIQYQASYQAAARIVTTADELLDTLMRM
jgi:flagellar hook-associated protein 1 FlgK